MNCKFRLLLLSLSLLLPFGIYATGKKKVHKRVLIVSSYSPIREKGNQTITTFINQIANKSNPDITVEYMDCESRPDFGQWIQWMSSMFRAYDQRPDAVVILGGEAWSAYRSCCPDPWKQAPVILGGVKKGFIDYENYPLEKKENLKEIVQIQTSFEGFKVAGYYYEDYIEKNLLLIKRLQPEIDSVAFVCDNRYTRRFMKPYLTSIFERIGTLKLHFLSGDSLSTSQLISALSTLGPKCAILTSGWYTDRNHYPHAYSMLQNGLKYKSSKFIYQLLDLDPTYPKYIGGYFLSGKDIGSDLANLTNTLFSKGFTPTFGLSPSKPQYYINYQIFSESGIETSRLPKGTVIYNEEASLFKKHPVQMSLFIFVGLFVITSSLTVLLYRRRRERNYKVSNQKLQHLLQAMPNMAVIYDENQTITDIINPKNDVLSIFTTEKLLGINVRDIEKLSPCFEDAAKLIQENVLKTATTRESCTFNYQVVTDKGTFFTESKTVPLDNNKVICFSHDVTARKMAEKEVTKLQSFLQSIIDNLPVGIFVKNASDEFRYIFYNEKTVDFDGDLPASHFLGQNDYEVNAPLASKYRKEDLQVINSEKPLTFERIKYDEYNEPCRWGVITKTRLINNDGSCFIIAILVDTTTIHKKEIELINTKNELAISLDAGALSAWSYNVNTRTFSSLHNQTISGKGMIFDAVYDILHPEDHTKFTLLFESLLTGVYEKGKEILRFIHNGKYRWYEVHAAALKSEKTSIVYQIIGTEKDISAEMERQQEIEESNQKLELAFETAGMILWDYSTEENIFFIHDKDSDLYKTIDTLDKFISIIDAKNQQVFRDSLDEIATGKTAVMDTTVRIHSEKDHYEWAQITAKATSYDKEGKALKIIGTRKYITEIVEAEQKLKAYIFKSDLAIKSSGIVQWDYDIINKVFSSPNVDSFMYHGISREMYLSFVHPDDVHLITDSIDDMILKKITSHNLHARVNIPGRGYRWVDIHAVVFEHDNEGNLIKITGLRRDVTDWKNMTEELIVLRDKAEESNRLKSAFLANMSHEIRTPLNAIVGFSNLITQTNDPAEISDYCKIIETNNDLLLQLINDILDLSKIEAGQLEFVYSNFDVVSIFTNLEQIYKYKVKKNVQLICDLPDTECIIYSEKNRLTQIISNFLSNASKFTSEGHIKMGYSVIPGGLRFYVTDTGKGIEPQNLSKVFERFSKFDTFVQGTGLGLSICQTITNRLNGEIGVESTLGQGTTFWFTIPCEITYSPNLSESGQKEPEIRIRNEERPRDNQQKPTILIAEDNDSNYLLLSVILKQNYRIIRAKTGSEAILLHKTEILDLIFMDIEMPEMNGLQATVEIRKVDQTTPIIALTAHAFDKDKEQSLKSGCNDYITKPVTQSVIHQITNRYC